jgi:hypothetical protein
MPGLSNTREADRGARRDVLTLTLHFFVVAKLLVAAKFGLCVAHARVARDHTRAASS